MTVCVYVRACARARVWVCQFLDLALSSQFKPSPYKPSTRTQGVIIQEVPKWPKHVHLCPSSTDLWQCLHLTWRQARLQQMKKRMRGTQCIKLAVFTHRSAKELHRVTSALTACHHRYDLSQFPLHRLCISLPSCLAVFASKSTNHLPVGQPAVTCQAALQRWHLRVVMPCLRPVPWRLLPAVWTAFWVPLPHGVRLVVWCLAVRTCLWKMWERAFFDRVWLFKTGVEKKARRWGRRERERERERGGKREGERGRAGEVERDTHTARGRERERIVWGKRHKQITVNPRK